MRKKFQTGQGMEVGVHCSMKACKRLDFLPFTCPNCRGIFCSEHRTRDSHNCSSSEDHEVERQDALTPSPLCSVAECGRRERVDVTCPHCHRILCLAHRHPEDHACPALPPPPPAKKRREPRPPLAGPAPRRGGAKSEALAARVGLMRLKQKADGLQSIPQDERIYYTVILPAGSRVQSAPLFFSKEWTVGKVVDEISRMFGIANHNDSLDSRKLALLISDGSPLQASQRLGACLDQLPSGSSVTLDYIC